MEMLVCLECTTRMLIGILMQRDCRVFMDYLDFKSFVLKMLECRFSLFLIRNLKYKSEEAKGKIERYLTVEIFFWIKTFIHFKCCYKIYLNIVSLQLIVFKIIIVYNKWKINLSLKPKLQCSHAQGLKVLCFLYRPSCIHLKKEERK